MFFRVVHHESRHGNVDVWTYFGRAKKQCRLHISSFKSSSKENEEAQSSHDESSSSPYHESIVESHYDRVSAKYTFIPNV